MGQNQNPIYISLAEAAKLAGFSRKYLNVLVYRKKLRVEMVDDQWFTTKDWLYEYLAASKRPAAAAPRHDNASRDRLEEAFIKQSEFMQGQFARLLEKQL